MKTMLIRCLAVLLTATLFLSPAALMEEAVEAQAAGFDAVSQEEVLSAFPSEAADDALDDAQDSNVAVEAELVDDAVEEVEAVDLVADTPETVEEENEQELVTDSVEVQVIGDGEELLEYMAAASSVSVNSTNFPDANFRKYVSDNFDVSPHDGYLSDTEIADVEEIDADGYQYRYEQDKIIRNLKGIEFFPRLEHLYCGWSGLTSLDVSKNTALTILVCSFNNLTSLDISHNTALTILDCESNKLSQLDVSQNGELQELCCYSNPLTALDIRSLKYILPYVNDQHKTIEDRGGFHGGYRTCTYTNGKYRDNPDYIELTCDPGVQLITSAASSTTTQTVAETPSITMISVPRNTRYSVNVGSVCQIDLAGTVGKKFRSSKKKVATVDANGLITARRVGKTKITFKVGRKRRTLTLTVVDPTIPKSVTLNMSGTIAVKQGDSVTLSATLPTGTNSGINWKSSRRSVATIKNGVVTFKRPGTVTITATTTRGKKKAKVKFKVNKYDAKKDLANYGWRTVQGVKPGRQLVFRRSHTGKYMSNHAFNEGDQIFVNLNWKEGGDAIAYDNGTYGYVQYKYIAW